MDREPRRGGRAELEEGTASTYVKGNSGVAWRPKRRMEDDIGPEKARPEKRGLECRAQEVRLDHTGTRTPTRY